MIASAGPAAGELLFRVKAAGVGHWGALVREGKLPNEHLPLILGFELSGIVEGIGTEITDFKLGDEAMGQRTSNSRGICRTCSAAGQNDGAKTENPELHTGSFSSNCGGHGLADALRLRVTAGQTVLIHGAAAPPSHV